MINFKFLNFKPRKLINTKTKGYSLVEMIIYVAILSVISFLVINTTLSFTRGYRDIVALRIVDHSGIDVMERITRDIRLSTQIDDTNSIFNTNPGVLSLIYTTGGVSTVTKFYLEGGIVKLDINGVYFGPLTLSSATVSSLVFTKLSGGISNAVKIDMTVSGTVGTVTKTKTYHSTVILRAI